MGLEKHMRRIIGITVSFILAICCCAGVARAEIRHVPERYPTIQAAIDVCFAGDIVEVGPGVWAESSNFGGARFG